MNKEIKVIIANDNDTEMTNTEEIFKRKGFNVLGRAKDGLELQELMKLEPDVVVLDVMLSSKDGFSIMEESKQKNLKTKFIVTSVLYSDTFIQKAMSLGASYYMIKPVDANIVAKRIEDIFTTFSKDLSKEFDAYSSEVVTKNKQLEERITNIFITVGIPAHIKGYQFLREAIKMAIKNPEIINSITKELYPSIANRFETSASKVERAIRHAIEVAWNRGKIENINSVFGIKVYSNNEKPTNGEFIALVADKMLLEG